MATKKTEPEQYVIIDTDVIDRFSKDPSGIGGGILRDLRSAIQAKYLLAYSEITLFELMDELPPEDEQRVIAELKNLIPFKVTDSIFVAAGRLGHLYKLDQHPIRDVGDKIIAATAVYTNSLIYTLNGRDYPRPFFKEIATRTIEYKDRGLLKCQVAHFLEPDLIMISKKADERNAKLKQQLDNEAAKARHATQANQK